MTLESIARWLAVKYFFAIICYLAVEKRVKKVQSVSDINSNKMKSVLHVICSVWYLQ